MPDFNDVVRHVILRILVDSSGLAEELAKARAQLKSAEQNERESNKARAKDAEQVTKAYERQNQALHDNIAAHDQLSKASDKNAQTTSERVRQTTRDVQDSTKSQIAQLKAVEDAKDREHKRTLERYKVEQKAVLDYDKGIAESAERMARERDSHSQELSARRVATTEDQVVRRATRPTRIDTETHSLQESARRSTSVADAAGYDADRAKADALNAADQRVTDSVRRRKSVLAEEKRTRQELINLAKQGEVLEQAALTIAEQRAQSSQSSATRNRRGLGASLGYAATTSGDALIGAARAVSSAPRSAARAGREFDAQEFDGIGREATAAEKRVASLFTRIGTGGEKAAEGARKVADAFRRLEQDRPSTIGNAAQSGLARVFSGLETVVGKAQTSSRRFFKDLGTDSDSGAKAVQRVSAQWAAFTDRITRNRVRVDPLPTGFRDLESLFSRAGSAASRFFSRLATDTDGNISRVQRLRAQFTGFLQDINRGRAGGQGGSLLGDMVAKTSAGLQALDGAFNGIGRHLISFQNLIFLVVAAFGPLAAILGAVGAAALGVASNLVSLAGSIAALPGLISAAVAGFGVLAAVIKPLTNVFSAYNAAQKAAAKGSDEASRAAVQAANAYQDAQRRLADAKLAYTRAIQDEPRAESKLADARKQAKRDIEDLSAAYKKLKFDEEGAQLDVDSAEQSYRRALVDPTANALDRKIARHDVEGAQFAQADQATDAQRTREDFAEAMKKGVEGMDAVVEALRSVQDARRATTDTLTDQTRAQQDLNEAKKDADAGGSAARTAMEAYQAELAKLSPSARAVAVAILGLSDAWKDLQKRLSEKVFGPVVGDVGKFKDILAELGSFLEPTAKAFGDLAHQAIVLLTNPEWKKFFSSQGEANGRIIAGLGQAALDAADGFRAIIETAQPFTDFVVGGIAKLAETFDKFANSREGRKDVAGFLDITKQRLGEVGKIIGNVVKGFAGFFTALNTGSGGKEDFTTWFNKGLISASKSFADLGKQAANPNSGFRKWLESVKPLLHDVAGFLASAGGFFGKLFSDPDNLKEAEKLLESISQKWLPKLADVFDYLSQSGIISKVADAIGTLIGAIKNIGESDGFKALSTFGDAIIVAAEAINGLVTVLGKIPGLLETIGVAIGLVFGAALLKKIATPVVGLIQFFRNATRSISNPANSPENDPTQSSSSSKKNTQMEVGRPGSTGTGGGSRRNTSANDPKAGNWFSRKWNNYRDATDQDAPTTPVSVDRREKTTGTTSSTTSKPGIFSTVRQNAKDTLLGDTKVEPTLGRMEVLLRQIEINTRRSGGTSGTRGTGGGTGGGSPTRPTGGGGGGGGGSRTTTSRQTTRRTTSRTVPSILPTLFDEDLPVRPSRSTGVPTPISIDRNNPVGEALPTRLVPNATGGTVDTSRTTVLPQQTRQNEERNRIRQAAGLPPLDSSYTNVRQQRTTTAINNPQPTLDADPNAIAQYPVSPTSDRGKAERLRAVENARRVRTGQAPLDADAEPTLRSKNLSGAMQQRLNTVAESQARRQQGGGTIPIYDEDGNRTTATSRRTSTTVQEPETLATTAQVNNRRSGTTETSAQRRKRLAQERYNQRNQANTSRRTATTTVDEPEPETPAKKPKRNARPDIDVNETQRPTQIHPDLADEPIHTVATKEETGTSKPAPTRDASGRITSPYPADVDRSLGTPAYAFPGQRPEKEKTRRNAQTRTAGGQFGPRKKPTAVGSGTPAEPALADVEEDDTRSSKKRSTRSSRGRGIGGRFINALKNDSGSAPVSLLTGGLAGGDDEYDEGYSDGLNAATGGTGGGVDDDGKKKPTRKEKRAARKEARRSKKAGRRGVPAIADDLFDDVLDDDLLDDGSSSSSRRRSSTGEPEEDSRKGGRGGRSGGRLSGLGKRFGGSLGRGLLGGGIAAIAGGAVQLGGDAVIDKFVKNDKDQKSLSGGLAAVTTGAGLGAMFGPAGALVGGAVGGIYALFKDKNLRDFVEKKLSKLGGVIVDGLKSAGTWIGNFFTKTIPGWAEKAFKFLGGLVLDYLKFWYVTLPLAIGKAFIWLMKKAGEGIAWVLGKFVDFLKFWYIDLPLKVLGFFAQLAVWAGQGVVWLVEKFLVFLKFWYIDLPLKVLGFFKQLGGWALEGAQNIGKFFLDHFITPLTDFFTKKIPEFFTKTIPDAIKALPGFIHDHVIKPIMDFFGGLKAHVSFSDIVLHGAKDLISWVKGLFGFGSDAQKNMSGGFVKGVYQGIEDKTKVLATPGEFYVRRSVAQKPENKQFLTDFNEGRIDVASLYGGLSAATAPQVMAMIPPEAAGFTGKVPTVVNHTINHAPLMGDVTIHNPVREKSDTSLRRQVQIAANRHRR